MNLQEEYKITLSDQLALERTRLANERTMLAYIRTALVLISLGGGMSQFLSQFFLKLLGIILIMIALLIILVGIFKFCKTRKRWQRIL